MTKFSVPEVPGARFWPGDFYMTPGVAREVDHADMVAAAERHCLGGRGGVPLEDQFDNDEALETGGRLLSEHCDRNGVGFRLVTTAERNMTVAFLRDE